MNNIQRYTRGKFGKIEKHDGGEFVYYHNHDDEIREHLEREVFLNEEYGKLSYKYNDLKDGYLKEFDKYCKMSDDLLSIETIQSKKYLIIASVALLFNSGLIGYILWMN
jgi:hypothetical protein